MKDFKIYIIVAGILLGIYLIAEYNEPKPVNWAPTFYYGDKIPLGTYVFYHRLQDIFPGSTVTKTNASFYSILHDTTLNPGNYLVIAKTVAANKLDFTEMVNFIKKGNSIFICAYNFKDVLADTLKLETGFEYQKGNSSLNFVSKALKRPADYTFDKDICNQYFQQFDTAKATVIGVNNNGHSTLIRYKFGSGNLFISANPGVFSNYSLLSDVGAEYAAKALSYMPLSKNIYWDEYQNGDIAEDESLARVFFNSPNLEWAYYISLFGLVIFVLYEVKRRQRVIPVIEPLANSTLGFVSVVGQVYYEQRNNTNIASKKITYLLERLREDYRVKTNKLDEEFIDVLNNKLNIDRAMATDLVRFIKNIDAQGYVSDQELIQLNRLIEKIYKQIA
jgi:hypothetical protein